MDPDYLADREGLRHAVDLLCQDFIAGSAIDLPTALPETGIGARVALDRLAPRVIGEAAKLGSTTSFAHMDPPTPWITWATTFWNASLNQNLLHPATAPAARDLEALVVDWLAPAFGMSGGHMTPGSTIANLTALWAAREGAGITQVIASADAHLSIGKVAHLLGLEFRRLATDPSGGLNRDDLPEDLSRAALVLTAGTTSTGAIDPLDLAGRAAWTHVDAAWAGPLRLTRHAERLAGIEDADSIAISAHKWLFQPKESALVLFRDHVKAAAAISFGSAYLAAPNVGVLGSHGATAVPLLATLLAWGRQGLATRIERCVGCAERFARWLHDEPSLDLLMQPHSAIVAWAPKDDERFDAIFRALTPGSTSVTTVNGKRWFRNVAANPSLDVDAHVDRVRRALETA